MKIQHFLFFNMYYLKSNIVIGIEESKFTLCAILGSICANSINAGINIVPPPIPIPPIIPEKNPNGIDTTNAQGQDTTNKDNALYNHSENTAPLIKIGGIIATNTATNTTIGVYIFENFVINFSVGAFYLMHFQLILIFLQQLILHTP